MTASEMAALSPVMRAIVRKRCNERGIGIEDFPSDELPGIEASVERASAMTGTDLLRAQPRKSDEEIERERNQDLIQSFLRTVPTRYRDADLQRDFSSPFVDELYRGQSAIVVGGNGIGKTRLAWALSKRWKEERPSSSVIVAKGARLLSEVKAIEGDWYRYIETGYGRCDHLFIDEIDKIKGSEADWMLLTYLIDYRYEWTRQTVVMGNCQKDEAMRLMGQSSYSRLSGDGARAYSLSGTDRRKQGSVGGAGGL